MLLIRLAYLRYVLVHCRTPAYNAEPSRVVRLSSYIFCCLLSGVLGLFPLKDTHAALKPTGLLQIEIRDRQTGKLTTERVRLTQSGKPVKMLSDQAVAVSYGLWDHADGYVFQPDSSVYVSGQFALRLLPGTYQLALMKGNEYISQQHTLIINSNQTVRKTYTLTRWINMADRGWYSADDHIHIRRSPGEYQSLMN